MSPKSPDCYRVPDRPEADRRAAAGGGDSDCANRFFSLGFRESV